MNLINRQSVERAVANFMRGGGPMNDRQRRAMFARKATGGTPSQAPALIAKPPPVAHDRYGNPITPDPSMRQIPEGPILSAKPFMPVPPKKEEPKPAPNPAMNLTLVPRGTEPVAIRSVNGVTTVSVSPKKDPKKALEEARKDVLARLKAAKRM